MRRASSTASTASRRALSAATSCARSVASETAASSSARRRPCPGVALSTPTLTTSRGAGNRTIIECQKALCPSRPGAKRPGLLAGGWEKTRTEQVDLRDTVGAHVYECHLLDDLGWLPLAAHLETPAESASGPDPFATGVEDDELGGTGEPALETPRDLGSSRTQLRSSRQQHPCLRRRRQAVREPFEVAQRESGKEKVWCGLVNHVAQGSGGAVDLASTVRSIFGCGRLPLAGDSREPQAG